jgi:hypothetical protein
MIIYLINLSYIANHVKGTLVESKRHSDKYSEQGRLLGSNKIKKI